MQFSKFEMSTVSKIKIHKFSKFELSKYPKMRVNEFFYI